MICAYSKCGREFEPSRGNQICHREKCRELAKAEKVIVVKVPRGQVDQVKRTPHRLANLTNLL